MTANPISTIGLMLTLAGLVGSFFNVQLSQWLRDLLALEQKVRLNRAQGNTDQAKAIVECRIEKQRLSNWQTYTVNALVLAFVMFVLGDALLMVRSQSGDPIYCNVVTALWVFLVFFLGMSGWLMSSGYRAAGRIAAMLDSKEAD
jgi:K+-transporting ATPase A subunit